MKTGPRGCEPFSGPHPKPGKPPAVLPATELLYLACSPPKRPKTAFRANFWAFLAGHISARGTRIGPGSRLPPVYEPKRGGATRLRPEIVLVREKCPVYIATVAGKDLTWTGGDGEQYEVHANIGLGCGVISRIYGPKAP